MNKQVSCIILQPIFEALRQKHVPPETLCQGVPYSFTYLRNKDERIEWDAYCTIMGNLRPHFSDDDLERLGFDAVSSKIFYASSVIVRLFPRPYELYIWFASRPGGAGMQWFTCIRSKTFRAGKNRLTITLELPPGYRYCREFFLITKGSFTAGPRIVGLGPAHVVMRPTERGATYDIVCPEGGGFFSRARKAMTLPLALRRAARELNDANVSLLQRYSELEEVQGKSQRQAIQLKVAYNIGKHIRANLDLDSTLQAIVQSLVDVAHFASATISLDAVVDEETLSRFMRAGEDCLRPPDFTRSLDSHAHRIGQVRFWLHPGSGIREAEDLLDYIVPTIAMAVDDALSFKTVNDLRESLQRKVDERTKELQHINETLKKSQARRDRLFSNISHEFRTPLTLILGPIETMLKESRGRIMQKRLSLMKRNAEKLLRLINQILELSRLQSGDVTLSARESDFVQFLRGVTMTYRSLAETRRIRLTFQSDRVSCPVFFDREKAETLFSNLLSNAFKFTPDGGRIEVRICISETGVEVRVRDSGAGIPESELPRIFERFYQGSTPGSHNIGGTGIGLALTKELVELHHGTISVTSKVGAGTEFLISLPTGRDHLRDEECAVEPAKGARWGVQWGAGRPAPRQAPREDVRIRGKKTILIIDDDPDVRQYLKDIVSPGVNVVEAADGEQGVQRARKMIPDLIVCDVMMPRQDGYQVCRTLKDDLRTSHIPIILLTARAGTESTITGLEAGADDYIVKPFIANELLARMHNLMTVRENLRRRFSFGQFVGPEQSSVPPSEDAFLRKARNIIETHMGDESFRIDAFSREIGLSRTQLHRKLVALTNCSARDFLQSLRLRRAYDLLHTNAGTVSEIAYQVGFRDPSHFAKRFRRQFGVAPGTFLPPPASRGRVHPRPRIHH